MVAEAKEAKLVVGKNRSNKKMKKSTGSNFSLFKYKHTSLIQSFIVSGLAWSMAAMRLIQHTKNNKLSKVEIDGLQHEKEDGTCVA